jgi:hypothetical protein
MRPDPSQQLGSDVERPALVPRLRLAARLQPTTATRRDRQVGLQVERRDHRRIRGRGRKSSAVGLIEPSEGEPGDERACPCREGTSASSKRLSQLSNGLDALPSPGGQALLNCSEDFFIGRKSQRCLLRGQVLANPDREFAPSTLNQLRFEAGYVLDARRRTGGSGVIVSNLAVADANAGHPSSPRGRVNS